MQQLELDDYSGSNTHWYEPLAAANHIEVPEST